MVSPYPLCIEEDRHDIPMEDCWYARPQLFFTCVLRPKDRRLPKNRTYKSGPDDIVYTLVFFSTFEKLKLPIKGPMEDAGVIKLIKLYEPSPTPCLCVADVQNMVGRVPLMPLFLAGNSTPTIPHIFSKRKDSGFSSDSTSSQGESSLIRSTRCCMIVCTSMYEYARVCTSMYEYVRVCISIIRGCKYSWSAHIFLSVLAPKYNVMCLGDASVHL